MKTAVLITGQPRLLDEHKDSIMENLISPNNADVFMHMWYSEDDLDQPFKWGKGWVNDRIEKDAHLKAIDFFKPKACFFEKQITFPELDISFKKTFNSGYGGGYESPDGQKSLIQSTQSMWYSINMAFSMMDEYSYYHKIDYGSVIKTRFDVSLNRPLKMTDFDQSKMWHEGHSYKELMNNWINFSNYNNMMVYCNIFGCLSKLYHETGLWVNEYFVPYSMNKTGIEIATTPMGLRIKSKEI